MYHVSAVAAALVIAGGLLLLTSSMKSVVLPHTLIFRKVSAGWTARLDEVNRRLDRYQKVLENVEERDDNLYRTTFGLDCIADGPEAASYADTRRSPYSDTPGTEFLRETVSRMDALSRRVCAQSNALDEVRGYTRHLSDIATAVPSIPPLRPKEGTYTLSSPFGWREDPVYGGGRMHWGQDFGTDRGNPVHATGDGIVEVADSRYAGYGREVMINHGYGYRTRYAHLSRMNVSEGDTVRRGDVVGFVGSTGKSTGPHLHYEVIFRDVQVDPLNYMDLSMSVDDYAEMTGGK